MFSTPKKSSKVARDRAVIAGSTNPILDNYRWVDLERERINEAENLAKLRPSSVKELVSSHNKKLQTPSDSLTASKQSLRKPLADIAIDSNRSSDMSVIRRHSVDELKLKYTGNSVVIPENQFHEKRKLQRSNSCPSPSVLSALAHDLGTPASCLKASNITASFCSPHPQCRLWDASPMAITTPATDKSNKPEFAENGLTPLQLPINDNDDVDAVEGSTLISLAVEGSCEPQIIREAVYPFSPNLKGRRGEIECIPPSQQQSKVLENVKYSKLNKKIELTSNSRENDSNKQFLDDNCAGTNKALAKNTKGGLSNLFPSTLRKLFDAENIPPSR